MSTAALPLIVATPTPAPAPTPAAAGSNGAPAGENAPFARELQRARQDEAPREPGSGDAGSGSENGPAQGPQAPSGPSAQSAQAGRTERQRIQRERAAHDGTPAKAARSAHAVDAAQLLAGSEGARRETDAADADAAAAEGGTATDAASLLAGLMAGAASRAAARTQPEVRTTEADAQGVGAAAATGSDGLRAGLRDAARQGAQAGAGDAAQAMRADELRTEDDGGRPVAKHDGGAFALQPLNLQAAMPLAATPAAQAAPGADVRDAHVAAPLGSPEFAPAVGAQVSLLVREGVQEARLQLNPAEMGPVTVKIQIDGSNAQVTMSAEQAPTRQALEQALPVLAGALREGGLTLTGGGVFEQPRQPREGQPAPRGGRSGDREEDAAVGSVGGAAAQRWTSRGVVDLYA